MNLLYKINLFFCGWIFELFLIRVIVNSNKYFLCVVGGICACIFIKDIIECNCSVISFVFSKYC